jgi:hypothetical protein
VKTKYDRYRKVYPPKTGKSLFMFNKVDLKIDNHGSKTTKMIYIIMVFKKLKMVSSFERTGDWRFFENSNSHTILLTRIVPYTQYVMNSNVLFFYILKSPPTTKEYAFNKSKRLLPLNLKNYVLYGGEDLFLRAGPNLWAYSRKLTPSRL